MKLSKCTAVLTAALAASLGDVALASSDADLCSATSSSSCGAAAPRSASAMIQAKAGVRLQAAVHAATVLKEAHTRVKLNKPAASRTLQELDTNHDGRVDKDEIGAFAARQGLDADAAAAELPALDTDGDGSLNDVELAAALGTALVSSDEPSDAETTHPTVVTDAEPEHVQDKVQANSQPEDPAIARADAVINEPSAMQSATWKLNSEMQSESPSEVAADAPPPAITEIAVPPTIEAPSPESGTETVQPDTTAPSPESGSDTVQPDTTEGETTTVVRDVEPEVEKPYVPPPEDVPRKPEETTKVVSVTTPAPAVVVAGGGDKVVTVTRAPTVVVAGGGDNQVVVGGYGDRNQQYRTHVPLMAENKSHIIAVELEKARQEERRAEMLEQKAAMLHANATVYAKMKAEEAKAAAAAAVKRKVNELLEGLANIERQSDQAAIEGDKLQTKAALELARANDYTLLMDSALGYITPPVTIAPTAPPAGTAAPTATTLAPTVEVTTVAPVTLRPSVAPAAPLWDPPTEPPPAI